MRKTHGAFQLAILLSFILGQDIARAQWAGDSGGGFNEVESMPLTLQDLTGKSKVEIRLPMLFEEGFFGIAPLLTVQYGLGHFAVGASFPMALATLEGVATTFVAGNPTLDMKGRWCREGSWQICVGGAFAMGFGYSETMQIDLTVDPIEISGTMLAVTHAVGLVGHQDPVYHSPETLVLRPLAVFSLAGQGIFMQAEFGLGAGVPMVNTEGRETNLTLMYQLAFGAKMDELIPVIEFRGATVLPQDDADEADSAMWVSAGFWVDYQGVFPLVRLSVPLNDNAKNGSPVHVEVGLAAQY